MLDIKHRFTCGDSDLSKITTVKNKNKTVLINISGGAKSRVQPLPELFQKHTDEKLEAHVEGTLSAAKETNLILSPIQIFKILFFIKM